MLRIEKKNVLTMQKKIANCYSLSIIILWKPIRMYRLVTEEVEDILNR